MKKLSITLLAFLVMQSLSAQTTIHTHDLLGRVTQIQYANGEIETFTYDAVGNRILVTTPTPLPVELIKLIAYPTPNKKRQSTIDWITQTEVNADKFSVQHSTDGINFITIGTVKAFGNTNEKQEYTLDHLNPIVGVNYYRLLTTDLDGSIATSHIVSVTFTDKYTTVLFPNPTNNETSLQIEGDVAVSNIHIVDMLGRTLNVPITKQSTNQWNLDVSKLTAGSYRVVYTVNETVEAIMLSVQK